MNYQSQLWSAPLLNKGAKIAATFVTGVGCLVLTGWILDISVLKSVLPNTVTMKPNTALGFILAGNSLFLSAEPTTSKKHWIGQFCSLAVALLGLVTLSEYIFGWDLGIDQLLFVDDLRPVWTLNPGRMSLLTTVCFVLIGSALWLSGAKRRGLHSLSTVWVERLAILASLLAAQAIVTYLYQVQSKIGSTTYTQMAVHTAVCFVVLAIGILMANSDIGVTRIITAASAGGIIARQLLPAALAIPLILGLFRITTARIGLLEPDFGTSVLVVLYFLALTTVITWNAKQIHRFDLQRQSALTALAQTNDDLEARIQERTAQLAEQVRIVQRQAELLELTSDAIFVRDKNGAITYWNRGAEAMYGWTREEASKQVTHTLLQTQVPEGIDLDQALLQQQSWQGELIHTRKDGRQIIVDSRQVLIRDQQGSSTGFLEVNRDITERKIAEQEIWNLNQELQRQLAQSQTLLEVLPIGVAIALDPYCEKIQVNSALAKMLGIAANENASLSAPEEERPSYKIYQNQLELAPEDLPLQRAAAHGIELRDLEIDVVRHDDTTITMLGYASPLIDEDGRTRGSIGAFLNINERKQSDIALQHSLKELADFKFALDKSSIVAITNAQGTITYVNDKFCQLSQYSPAELIGQTHRIINSGYHPKEFFQQMWATITKGQVWQGEIQNRAKDGTYYWVATTIVPFLDTRGQPFQYIAIRSDITNRKEAETQLQQINITLEQRVEERTAQLQEANKQLEAFSYTVAHDLRAPLRGIQGFAQALVEDYGDSLDEIATEYIQYIFDGTERMNNLVSDLLTYSRLSREQVRLIPIQLTQVVAEAMAQLEAELRDRQADITVAEDLPSVWGNRSILVQMLANLLSNGMKFVAEGVQPQIRVWAEILGDKEMGKAGETGEEYQAYPQPVTHPVWVRLWVEDNGIGIEPAYQEQIFGVFERLHSINAYPGTGIGLAIVRKGAERLGGNAGLESALGQGSRFWLELQEVK